MSDHGVRFDVTEEQLANSGLGLLGMKERAALIGAQFDVESMPGQGTTIYLRAEVADNAEDTER